MMKKPVVPNLCHMMSPQNQHDSHTYSPVDDKIHLLKMNR